MIENWDTPAYPLSTTPFLKEEPLEAPFDPLEELIEHPLDELPELSLEDLEELEPEQAATKSSQAYGTEQDATQIYLREMGASPLLSAEEERHYAQLVQAGDLEARNHMIRCNLRLVVKISRRYLNRGLSLLDLVEEGNLGLIRAVEKFDPSRGFRFSTYATWWIRQNIERALMNQTRTIRLPIHIIKELNSYLRKLREISQHLEAEPSYEDLAKALNMPVAEVNRLMSLNEKTLSVDTPVGDENERPLLEVLADQSCYGPAEELESKDTRFFLNHCLKQLNEKQRQIIAHRFGLHGYEESTLEDVGKEVGLTRERVRQIQVETLKQLRAMLEQRGSALKPA